MNIFINLKKKKKNIWQKNKIIKKKDWSLNKRLLSKMQNAQ
jgi:hypothetical protein